MKNLIALATLAACGIVHAQTAQTFASLMDVYSYTEEGVNATGRRYARIGILELDGTGAALAGRRDKDRRSAHCLPALRRVSAR